MRDGFTDQYFGTRLVFPGTLLALSTLFPEAFPYQRHWKQSQTHPAFWQLSPTIDHVIPVARGGEENNDSNVVTTSMLSNSAKSNWLLAELGWSLRRTPANSGWDGLLPWFLAEWAKNPILQQDLAVRNWYQAALAVRAGAIIEATSPDQIP